MSSKLTPLQQKVFDLLDKKPNTDVQITELYKVAYGSQNQMTLAYVDRYGEEWGVRDMQQKLGPLLSRINGKLKRGKIEPGLLKQTYRLAIKKD